MKDEFFALFSFILQRKRTINLLDNHEFINWVHSFRVEDPSERPDIAEVSSYTMNVRQVFFSDYGGKPIET